MVEDPVAHLAREVEAAAAALEHVDHPQALDVVLEAPPVALAQHLVEGRLAGVAEGRVAEVVAHRDRLHQVLVQLERPRDGARQGRDLERVGEAGAVVVARRGDEDLGLVLQAAERGRVQDAVAVALEGRPERVRLLGALADGAVGARRARAEGRLAAAGGQNPNGIGNTHGPGTPPAGPPSSPTVPIVTVSRATVSGIAGASAKAPSRRLPSGALSTQATR